MQALKKAAIVAAPLRVQTITSLRRAIIDGELAPGQRLREAELSEATGVSRSVIREALRQLDAEGLIETVPNKGAIVRTVSPAEAEDIYRIRALIEGYAASLFVEHASDEDMEKLVSVGEAVIEAYAVGGVKSILRAKDRFYAILYAGSGSEVLRLLYEVLNARISLWRARGLSGQAERGAGVEEGIRDIREIVAAVTRRDAAEAERRVRQRVMTSASDVLQTFAQAQEDTNAGKGMTAKRASVRGVSPTTLRSRASAGAPPMMAADRE